MWQFGVVFIKIYFILNLQVLKGKLYDNFII